MADKKISDFTAKATIDAGDFIEIETVTGNSRKVDAKLVGLAFGTGFPAGPAAGDRFTRTDRNIEYYYDGTQWLSTALYSAMFNNDIALPITGGTAARLINPYYNVYNIYVISATQTALMTTTTASNYFVTQLKAYTGATPANLGSTLSTQNVTINTYASLTISINAVVASTVNVIDASVVETGIASGYLNQSITYRLIG